MRVQGVSPQSAAREVREKPAAREVTPTRTPAKPAELRRALGAAYAELHGKPASPKLLDVLTAQACTETARGTHMFNNNFGGIKGQSPEGMTARCKTREIFDGREVTITDGFRAYSTQKNGAKDYIALLERRFPRALEKAEGGDVDGFVRELKAGNYFTADPTAYASAVRSHLAMGLKESPFVASTTPAAETPKLDARDFEKACPTDLILSTQLGEFATSRAVARVLDAVSASSAQIASPIGEDDERA